jgi:hypothetical protein
MRDGTVTRVFGGGGTPRDLVVVMALSTRGRARARRHTRRGAVRQVGRCGVVVLVFALAASIFSVAKARQASAGVVDQQVAVPSYIPPNGDADAWNRLIASPSGKAGVIVANVANGPDFVTKGMWTDVMSRAHNSGKRVLGYVDTGYMGLTGQTTRLGSSRSADWIVQIEQIEQDINRWYALYPGLVDGIFFDQGHNLCGDGDSIVRLYQFINQFEKRYHPGATTVLNPGAVVPQCYEWSADVLLTYESSFEGYMQRADQPGDLNYHSPNWTPLGDHKFWHIIYGVPEDQVANVIATSRSRNAGYVFVTDDVMVNPYDTLPQGSYWSNELGDVNGVGGYISGPAPRDPNFGPAATPGNLRVDSTDYTSTRISWDYAPGADRYRVYVDGQHIAEVPDDTTTVTIGGLAPNGHSYNIGVSAISPNGYSSPPSTTHVRPRSRCPMTRRSRTRTRRSVGEPHRSRRTSSPRTRSTGCSSGRAPRTSPAGGRRCSAAARCGSSRATTSCGTPVMRAGCSGRGRWSTIMSTQLSRDTRIGGTSPCRTSVRAPMTSPSAETATAR